MEFLAGLLSGVFLAIGTYTFLFFMAKKKMAKMREKQIREFQKHTDELLNSLMSFHPATHNMKDLN